MAQGYRAWISYIAGRDAPIGEQVLVNAVSDIFGVNLARVEGDVLRARRRIQERDDTITED